jgi:uncharacterized protein YbjT (DUF2867 family)
VRQSGSAGQCEHINGFCELQGLKNCLQKHLWPFVVEVLMKVLLAGANSYIGTLLIPVLLEKGHDVICLVRDKNHFYKSNPHADSVTVISGDLLRRQSIALLPDNIDAAYYLVNAFTQTSEFAALGALSAQNFMEVIKQVNCKQIITLSDINNQSSVDSAARMAIEDILRGGQPALTVLNITMIIGRGSTALEMFNALTSKTPIVISQNWEKTRVQPIDVSAVLEYMEACLLNEATFDKNFDIGGPEVSYFKHMVLVYIAICKNFKPNVVALPFLTGQLSAQLLNILTPLSYPGAKSLIESLKADIVCSENAIAGIIPLQCLSFKQSLRLAYDIPVGEQRIHS